MANDIPNLGLLSPPLARSSSAESAMPAPIADTPASEADLEAFDDLLRSYRRLSLIDQVVLRGRLLWHILGIESSEQSYG